MFNQRRLSSQTSSRGGWWPTSYFDFLEDMTFILVTELITGLTSSLLLGHGDDGELHGGDQGDGDRPLHGGTGHRPLEGNVLHRRGRDLVTDLITGLTFFMPSCCWDSAMMVSLLTTWSIIVSSLYCRGHRGWDLRLPEVYRKANLTWKWQSRVYRE